MRCKKLIAIIGLSAIGTAALAQEADIQRRYSQYAAVQQAVYQLAGESTDTDADGTLEAAAWTSGAGVPGGGVIPAGSGAPKTDGFGGVLGYCVWDNGTVTSSTNRLTGSGTPSAPAVAVVSFGLDNLYQTSCADVAAGVTKGDDYAFWLTNNQMHSAAANTVSLYWGAPVADAAGLTALALTPAALHEGEVRLVRADNKLYRWNSGTGAWAALAGGESSSAWVTTATTSAYLPGKAAVGQAAVGLEQLVVNGGATTNVLGLKGSAALTGIGIYDQTGSAVTGFFGINSTTGQLVVNSTTSAGLSIRSNGSEVARFAGDGSLSINGVTVIDSARNITGAAITGTTINATNALQVGGVTVVDSARNITGAAITGTTINATNALQVGGVTVIDGSRNVYAGNGTFSGVIQASSGSFSGGVVASTFNGVPLGLGANAVSTNIAIGSSAMSSNTTGSNNVATGVGALASNTTGSNNIAYGQNALNKSSTANDNMAFGAAALANNTTGNSNLAMGTNALTTNTTGKQNIAFGQQALTSNTGGSNNIAAGYQALYSNTTGYNNIATGTNALYRNTTGTDNVASGHSAMYNNTGGSNNIAAGYQALYANTTGARNIAFGKQALTSNTGGSDNIAAGYVALYGSTEGSGSKNIALGSYTLFANTTGSNNIATGYTSMQNNTTGSNNIAIGYSALQLNTTGNNNVVIGYNAGGSLGAAGYGNVIIGGYAGQAGNNQIFLADGSGNLRASYISGIWNFSGTVKANNVTLTSDVRFKKNITSISDALGLISQLEGVRYDYRRDEFPDRGFSARRQLGFIAQQIEPYVPELVETDDQGFKSVNYAQMTALLATGIKELNSVVQQHAAVVNRFALNGDAMTIRASSVGVTSLKAGSVETDRLVTSGAFSMVDTTGRTVFSMNQGQGRMASLQVEDSLAAKSLALSGAGVISGNLTAAALIPSGSAVPVKGFYAPSESSVGVSSQGALIAKFDDLSVNLTRDLVMGPAQVKVIDKDGFVYAAHTAAEREACAGREGAIARGANGQLFICQ